MLCKIIGDVGTGKTLFMTYIADQCPDIPIYSNFNIKLPNVQSVDVFSVGDIKYGIILLDEMYEWLESRLSGSEINIHLSRIMFNSRKRGLDVYGSAQLGSSLDRRFNDMANYSANMRIFCLGLAKDLSGYLYIINEKYFYELKYKKATELFDIYNTYQEQEVIHKTLFDANKINPTIDKYAKDITKMCKKNKIRITKGLVVDIFLQNKWDLSLQSLTYYRIQSMKALS